MRKIIINLGIFQIGWFVCILAGNIAAIIFTAAALLIHGKWLVQQQREWLLIAVLTSVGCLWDYMLARCGLIEFAGGGSYLLPLWMVCLWLLFATTVSHSLAWLRRYLWLAALLAAIAAPASYYAGTLISDSQLTSPIEIPLLVIAAGWAVLVPLSLYSARKFLYAHQ